MSLVCDIGNTYNAVHIQKLTEVVVVAVVAGSEKHPQVLKPFLFKTRDGFLLGVAPDASEASPCAGCVERWLTERKVWLERSDISELNVRRDLVAEVVNEGSPHTLYEINRDGSVTRLDCMVFPHPECSCGGKNYIAVEDRTKRTNFALSPIYQIKCVRYGTPEGNLWWTQATGESPLARETIVTHSVARDRETSRFAAIDEWLKKAAEADFTLRVHRGEKFSAEVLQTGMKEIANNSKCRPFENVPPLCGAGKDENSATVDALIKLAKVRTIKNYASSLKNPMLIVGMNNWVRTRVPFFLLQRYDLHFFFYPNSMPAWVIGLGIISRVSTDEKPLFFFGAGGNPLEAIDQAIFRCLETVRPPNADGVFGSLEQKPHHESNAKLHLWWTNWVYRCPKISLKDVLHLEPYKKDIETWKNFFRDGEAPVKTYALNHPLLPGSLRKIVAIESEALARLQTRNVRGIGSLSAYQDLG